MSDLSLPMYTHEKNTVQFSEHAVQNDIATNKLGRVAFDKILRIHISVPGQKDVQCYEVDREYPEGWTHPNPDLKNGRKNEMMYKRFGKYIEEYKRNSSLVAVSGTPIEKWAMVDVRQCAMLKSLGVHTVEALSDITDSNIANLGMGGRELVRKAKDWLQTAQNSAVSTQMAAEKRAVEDRFAILEQNYKELAEAMCALPNDVQSMIKDELAKKGKKAA
jgi:hypothetical protein